MNNLSPQQFKYNGKRYLFSAQVFEDDQRNVIPLDNNDILTFSYQNMLNSYCLSGEMTYIDRYGKIDKYLDKQSAMCQIYFTQLDEEYDDDITIQSESSTSVFKHVFLIESILILERGPSLIKYKFILVSSSIFNTQASLQYTNYDKEPQTLTTIYKSCLALAGFNCDRAAFENVHSNVKINYTTNENDTLISITNYLFNKSFFYSTTDDSLLCFSYDETQNSINLFDLKDITSFINSYTFMISLLKDNNEQMVEREQIQMATISDIKTSSVNQKLYTNKLIDYYLTNNHFVDKTQTTDQIIAYVNSHIESTTTAQKYFKLSQLENTHKKANTYWNSTTTIYSDVINSLFKNNSLVLNVGGDILRKPGSIAFVKVDRNQDLVLDDEEPTSLDDLESRFLGLESPWIISQVKHLINPNVGSYRQSIFMFRNFIPHDLQVQDLKSNT